MTGGKRPPARLQAASPPAAATTSPRPCVPTRRRGRGSTWATNSRSRSAAAHVSSYRLRCCSARTAAAAVTQRGRRHVQRAKAVIRCTRVACAARHRKRGTRMCSPGALLPPRAATFAAVLTLRPAGTPDGACACRARLCYDERRRAALKTTPKTRSRRRWAPHRCDDAGLLAHVSHGAPRTSARRMRVCLHGFHTVNNTSRRRR